jgi:hypothetical protein
MISEIEIEDTETLRIASERLGHARALVNGYQIAGMAGKISLWTTEVEAWESRRMQIIHEHRLSRTIGELSDEIVRSTYDGTFVDITQNV